MAHNFNVNNTLDAFKVPRNIYNAIQNASRSTGVNFTYLVEKAAAESSFNPDAKARTSSATGLFQFIESTWLGMVKNHGAKYGLQDYAAKIGADGRVASRKDRQEILELRKDPEIASYMAAEFAAENHQQLKNNVGGKIGSTELYMAHFMGAGGASAFLNAMKKNPAMAAADIFPREARANRNVFFDARTGAPRSLQQVHAFFDRKFNGAPAGAVKDSVMTASAA
ncbi:MAG: transglycosylase SLT domain-containing protein, partial [Micavibrio sp.]